MIGNAIIGSIQVKKVMITEQYTTIFVYAAEDTTLSGIKYVKMISAFLTGDEKYKTGDGVSIDSFGKDMWDSGSKVSPGSYTSGIIDVTNPVYTPVKPTDLFMKGPFINQHTVQKALIFKKKDPGYSEQTILVYAAEDTVSGITYVKMFSLNLTQGEAKYKTGDGVSIDSFSKDMWDSGISMDPGSYTLSSFI
jgi:hypothetical protein